MRVIFLDLDGVLTNAKTSSHWRTRLPCGLTDRTYPIAPFAPECVERLNRLAAWTDAKLCLSTTWGRVYRYRSLAAYVVEQGVTAEIIGSTPVKLLCRPRGRDIQQWLDEWDGDAITAFAILDDHDDMVHLQDHLVLTHTDHGLQDEHVDRVVYVLNNVPLPDANNRPKKSR